MPTVYSALELIVTSASILITLAIPHDHRPHVHVSKQLEHAGIIIMARIKTLFFSCRPPFTFILSLYQPSANKLLEVLISNNNFDHLIQRETLSRWQKRYNVESKGQ